MYERRTCDSGGTTRSGRKRLDDDVITRAEQSSSVDCFLFVFFCRLAITNHTCTSSYLQYLKKHISINRRWWWSVSRRLAALTSASRRVLFCFSPLMIDVLLLVLHSTNLRLSVAFACDFGFQ